MQPNSNPGTAHKTEAVLVVVGDNMRRGQRRDGCGLAAATYSLQNEKAEPRARSLAGVAICLVRILSFLSIHGKYFFTAVLNRIVLISAYITASGFYIKFYSLTIHLIIF